MDCEKTVCVLDASTYVGFWIVKGLISQGYKVHAGIQSHDSGETEIVKEIKEIERVEERLSVFVIDVLDYHSILSPLRGSCGLFCCLESPHGYDENMVDVEVRGAINVIEASGQTQTISKIVFTSSLTASIWTHDISSHKHIDESSWSNHHFCKKFKLWQALAKTQVEKAVWALAKDRMIDMVSINAGLVLGPCVAQQNPIPTISYLNGAAEMYENGVLAVVDVKYLVDVHIRVFEDRSTYGRYFCFNHIVNTEEETIKLAHTLSPLISLPPSYGRQGSEVFVERLRNSKLNKLVDTRACC